MYSPKSLIIRVLREQDTDYIVKWRNDNEIMDNLFSSPGLTREEHLVWLNRLKKDLTRREFILIEKQKELPIGTVGLSNIDILLKKGELGILIGEKHFWGKGYAREAIEFIINYSFEELGLNMIYLKTFANNDRAINLYRKTGFKKKELLKDAVLKNGIFRDVVIMTLSKTDWDKK